MTIVFFLSINKYMYNCICCVTKTVFCCCCCCYWIWLWWVEQLHTKPHAFIHIVLSFHFWNPQFDINRTQIHTHMVPQRITNTIYTYIMYVVNNYRSLFCSLFAWYLCASASVYDHLLKLKTEQKKINFHSSKMAQSVRTQNIQ